MTTALFAGSFDPPTNGHIDIAARSLRFCDKLVIGIGVNSNKKTLFTEGERADLISSIFGPILFPNVTVVLFRGLLVDFAKANNIDMIVRGVRSVSDFEYEMNLANINKALAYNIDTVFLPTSPELSIVSSSMVKEIASHGGDIGRFVPDLVAEAVYAKLKK
jgi:pantetheine-phosphate adenylyltransferase